MDTHKLKLIIIAILAIFAALYLGIAAATAQVEAVLWVSLALGLTICLALGQRIWLLIPFMTALSIRLPVPGQLSTAMIAQATVLGFLLLRFLMRRLPLRTRITELELWCLLFIICVSQAYLRNPVGLNIFGGATIGGRPYIEFAFTLAAAFALSILVVNPRDFVWWVRVILAGSILNFAMGALSLLFPRFGYYLGATFMSEYAQQTAAEERDPEAAGRLGFVRGISRALALWIASRMSPLKACLHPVWAPVVLFTLGAAAFSGFRSQLAIVGLCYFVGLCYRGGLPHVAISVVIGACALAMLAFVNLVAPLPPNVQRSLTFLPGTWEERYRRDAETSTDWRTEIWIEALTSDEYIRNKLLGDGLGMDAEAFRRSVATYATGTTVGGLDAHRANIMMSGDFHSGPIQTIRAVGYVGLLILLIGLVRVAVHAHRQIMRCRGTEWYPTVLFIGIPIVWGPFFWTFIFGSFTGGFTMLFMGTAVIRMLENNLPLPAYVPVRARPYQPLAQRNTRAAGSTG